MNYIFSFQFQFSSVQISFMPWFLFLLVFNHFCFNYMVIPFYFSSSTEFYIFYNSRFSILSFSIFFLGYPFVVFGTLISLVSSSYGLGTPVNCIFTGETSLATCYMYCFHLSHFHLFIIAHLKIVNRLNKVIRKVLSDIVDFRFSLVALELFF